MTGRGPVRMQTYMVHMQKRVLTGVYKAEPLAVDDTCELHCADVGVCRTNDGFVVFVDNALPGEILTARILSLKKGFARAVKERIIQPHDHAVEPPCKYFGECGGCSLQSLSYTAQLVSKQRQVEENFRRIAGLADAQVQTINPAPEQYHFRNTMEYTFTTLSDGTLGIGMKKASSSDIFPIQECILQSAAANSVLQSTLTLCRKYKLNAWSKNDTSGLLQHLVIRSRGCGDADSLLVKFVTSRDARKVLGPVSSELSSIQPNVVVGIVNAISDPDKPLGARIIKSEYTLHGQSYLTDRLLGREYQISANSFFQTNTRAADELYAAIERCSGLQSNDIVLDLYCGAGTIGLSLAAQCKRVIGIDIVPSAIADAKENAVSNGTRNSTFIRANLEKTTAKKLSETLPDKPTVIILDPARPGLSQAVVEYILNCKTARKIVYVSCNPATQARDVKKLLPLFKLVSLEAFDMYPQTSHVETLALLEKNSNE